MIIAGEKYVVNDELRSEFQGYTNEIISLQKQITDYDTSIDALKYMSSKMYGDEYVGITIYAIPKCEDAFRPNASLYIPPEGITTIMDQLNEFIKYQKKQTIHTLGNVYKLIQLKGEDDHPQLHP